MKQTIWSSVNINDLLKLNKDVILASEYSHIIILGAVRQFIQTFNMLNEIFRYTA